MKHKFLKQLIVVSVVISTMATLTPIKASAEWIRNDDSKWSYLDGYRYSTGWRMIDGTWYFFDAFGIMRTGWIYSNQNWYYVDLSGAMQKGVIQIEGKIYLFAETGEVQKGSCSLNGKIYYFDDNGVCIGNDVPMPVKGFDYYGNSTVPYIPTQVVTQGTKMSSEIPSDGTKQVKQYKVTFKDPDVEDSSEEIIKTRTIDEDTKMLLYKPSKSGYTFIEWTTKSDGDGTSYQYDDKVTIKSNLTLYAQWEVTAVTPDETVLKVTAITISGSNNLTVINTKGGHLQMTKKVTPGDATTQKVTWSVSNQGGIGTIDSTGKLTAVADGIVYVKATATDGTGVVSNEYKVTISGQ